MLKPILMIALLFLLACSPPDVGKAQISQAGHSEELDADRTNSVDEEAADFQFTGYGPGKSHNGTFKDAQATLFYDDDKLVGVNVTIQTASIETGIEGLNNHLKSDDFFDVEQYPTITFQSTSISDTSTTGVLDFHGVEKEIAFASNQTSNSYNADFLLDTEPFNFGFTGVNDEVRISFDIPLR